MEITRNQFESYEKVRQSGATNMLNLRLVSELTGLSKEECSEIIKNYWELNKRYGHSEECEEILNGVKTQRK